MKLKELSIALAIASCIVIGGFLLHWIDEKYIHPWPFTAEDVLRAETMRDK